VKYKDFDNYYVIIPISYNWNGNFILLLSESKIIKIFNYVAANSSLVMKVQMM